MTERGPHHVAAVEDVLARVRLIVARVGAPFEAVTARLERCIAGRIAVVTVSQAEARALRDVHRALVDALQEEREHHRELRDAIRAHAQVAERKIAAVEAMLADGAPDAAADDQRGRAPVSTKRAASPRSSV